MSRTSRITSIVVVLVVTAVNCGRDTGGNTRTIEPPPPRPAAMTGTNATIGSEPNVTTTGSPPPQPGHEQFEEVTIRGGRISMRRSLPTKNTAFRITNSDAVRHTIIFERDGGTVEARAPVEGGAVVILQLDLSTPGYRVYCSEPGHHEETEFETYRPR